MDRDKNLLFGVLAVQLRRITSTQLVEAAALWLAEPSQPLADRLIQLGALTPEDRDFLDSIVENTLHLHNEDAYQAYTSLAGHETWQHAVASAPDSEAAKTISTVLGLPLHVIDLSSGSISAVSETPGRYSRTSEYARGGMGRILLVHDQFLDRDIALKELLPFDSVVEDIDTRPPESPVRASAQLVGRFLREARVTGQLEHPSIVPVYELGRRPNGTLYYTMKLVRGQTLSRAIHDALSLPERLKLLSHVVDLCQALAYAHSRHVIHRDIKPSNIMIGGFGETVVIDWGLAKILGQEDIYQENLQSTWSKLAGSDDLVPPQTEAGAALGTPHYMSPEQASGNIESIDERSDVYALGAVLYELLTGRAPFLGRTTHEILHDVVHTGPKPVLDVVPDAPLELVQICAKAMAMEPGDRYQSAKELADDLIRFQTGALVRSYAYSPRELLVHYYRKHRAVWNTAAAGLIALLMVASVSYVNILNARNREREQRIEAEEVGHIAQVRLAQTLLNARNFDAANEVLGATKPDRRGWEWDFLNRNANRDRFTIPDTGVAQFTPDGQSVVAAPREHPPILYNATTGEQLREFVPPAYAARLLDVSVHPAGSQCATITAGRDVFLWSIPDGTVLAVLSGHGGVARSAEYSADGRTIVTAADDGAVRLWDAETGQLITSRHIAGAGLWWAALAHDDTLVCIGKDNRTYVTGTHADDAIRSVDGLWGDFTTDRRFFITSMPDAAEVHTTTGDDPVQRFPAESGVIQTARMSPDGTRIALVQERTIAIFDRNTGAARSTLGGGDALSGAVFTPQSDRIIGWNRDGHVWVWDLESERLLDSWYTHTDDLVTVRCDNTGEALLTIAVGKETRVWPLPSKSNSSLIASHADYVRALAGSDDGTRLASSAADGTIYVYDVNSCELRAALAAYSQIGTNALDLSSDGSRLVAAIDEHTTLLWNLEANAPLHTVFPGQGAIYDLEFAPGDATFATAGWDGTAKVWNAADGQLVSTLDGHSGSIRQLAFSPSGATLATASTDGTVVLWDLASGTQQHVLEAHHGEVESVNFSIDGTTCIAGMENGAAVVWSTDTGALIATLAGHARTIVEVNASPGDRLFTVAWDGLRVWDTHRYAELVHLVPLQGREYTDTWFHESTGALYVGARDGSVHCWPPRPTLATQPDRTRSIPFYAFVTADELEARLRRLHELAASPEAQPLISGAAADAVATLCLRPGDRILHIDGNEIRSGDDLRRALERSLERDFAPGDVVLLQFQRAGTTYDAHLRCMPEIHETITRTIPRDRFQDFIQGELHALRHDADIVHEVQERRTRQRGDASPAGYWMLSAASPEQRAYYRALGIAPGDCIQQLYGKPIRSTHDIRSVLEALESEASRNAVTTLDCRLRRGSLASADLTIRIE